MLKSSEITHQWSSVVVIVEQSEGGQGRDFFRRDRAAEVLQLPLDRKVQYYRGRLR